MADYRATIRWTYSGTDFAKGRYSREHTWSFDGGLTVPASPAPSSVPVPYSNPANVDPEEAFVAAISSCHMLTFVWVASRAGFFVESYEDQAVGTMIKNERGVPWVNQVTLDPCIAWGGPRLPTASEIAQLHHQAHEGCYIANSVKTEIVVKPPTEA
jgi:organic hydroperoxide reductase OsmC/OhrA